MSPKPRDALAFPASAAAPLEPYLPPPSSSSSSSSAAPLPHPPVDRPFTTLTFATSLDSALALAPGARTALSGPQSKAMTHHLRSRHGAILVGAGTAVADDPGLNCRIEGVWGYGGEAQAGTVRGELEGQPRPVVVDPSARWDWTGAKLLGLVREGRGRAPWVVVREGVVVDGGRRAVLEGLGGRVIEVKAGEDGRMEWSNILGLLRREGVESVMVEGGGNVINALLEPRNMRLVDSVIVTIAPTWLGEGGVVVSPPRRTDREGNAIAAARLRDVKWCPLGEDVVLCGRLQI